MKKFVSIMLVLAMSMSLTACGADSAGGKQEMLGMQYANHMTPSVDIGGETGA